MPPHPVLIDVRSYAEYMAGHLSGALCLPLSHLEHEMHNKVPDRQTPIIVYCSTGARSEQALGLLLRLGYSHVSNGGGAVELAEQMQMQLQPGM
jgi:phage shock protein E